MFSSRGCGNVRPLEQERVDALVQALDLQTVGPSANRWVVHVIGTYADSAGTVWMQVAPRPDGADGVILKLPTWATACHALAALAALPTPRRERMPVVPVMCTV